MNWTDENLRKVERIIRHEIENRKGVSKKDDVRNALRHLYMEYAGEVQEKQIDMLSKLVNMVGAENYMDCMSRSGKSWDMTIEDFLGNPINRTTSENDETKLRHVVEAIQTVRGQGDTTSVLNGFLLAFLHAAVETIRIGN